MPHIIKDLHDCTGVECRVTFIDCSYPDSSFAVLRLGGKEVDCWNLYFKSVESIRRFQREIGRALDQYEEEVEAKRHKVAV